MKRIVMMLLVLMWMPACALDSSDGTEAISDEPVSEQVSQDLDPVTAALSAAAEAGDPDAMALLGPTTNAACHVPNTCDRTRYSCGEPTAQRGCGGTFCGARCGPLNAGLFQLRQPAEVFRRCVGLNESDICIEWSRAGSIAIGCGC